MKTPTTPDEIISHRLMFDPENPDTMLRSSSPQPSGLAPRSLPEIPWPKGLAPVPRARQMKPDPEAPLPNADVLLVTWTVAEALALSDALTPGYRSKTDWYRYTRNWEREFKPLVKKDAPALIEDRLGLWFRTQIGKKSVVCVKSELHFARDGAKMPVRKLWEQMIREVNPELVITTGTAGAVGSKIRMGDVVVSRSARFDCRRIFKDAPFARAGYSGAGKAPAARLSYANNRIMQVTQSRLPDLVRAPRAFAKPLTEAGKMDVVTADFFAFDDTDDQFGLQGHGAAVDMGDAVLGLTCAELGTKAPAWIAVRNISDPQMEGGEPYKRQAELAGRIYEKYGYWTSINGAIACWAILAS